MTEIPEIPETSTASATDVSEGSETGTPAEETVDAVVAGVPDSVPVPTAEPKQPSRMLRVLNSLRTANNVTVTILAFVMAMAVGGIMMVLSNQTVLDKYGYFFQHPNDALGSSWDLIASGYTAMFQGAIFDPHNPGLHPLLATIVYATPLVFAGLAVAVPFRAGMFNIGGNGQLIVGAITASYAGFAWSLPAWIHLPVVVLAGMAGGMAYAGIVGVLKARTGAHEVITTIMLNNIASGSLLVWLVTSSAVFHDPHRQDPIGKPAKPSALLPLLGGADPKVTLAAPLAVVAAAAVWWLFSRSTLGFRLRAVGSNPEAARTAGISVARSQTSAMLIAGALMGLVGVSQVMGTLTASHALTPNIDAGIGFTGITVALLGRGNAWGVALAALLFGALSNGGGSMEASVHIPHDIVTVIEALIVVFVAAPALVREVFRLREAGKLGSVAPAAAVITAGEGS
jgi:general nucleoside transport system permease protein